MTIPEPPVNVRLVLVDGSEYPVDTVYVGIEDGAHVWQVVTGPPLEKVTGLKIDRLPGHTAVNIAKGYFSG